MVFAPFHAFDISIGVFRFVGAEVAGVNAVPASGFHRPKLSGILILFLQNVFNPRLLAAPFNIGIRYELGCSFFKQIHFLVICNVDAFFRFISSP